MKFTVTEQQLVEFIFSDKVIILWICICGAFFMIQLYIWFVFIRAIFRGIVKISTKQQCSKKAIDEYEEDMKPKYEWQITDYSDKTKEEKEAEINKMFGDRW